MVVRPRFGVATMMTCPCGKGGVSLMPANVTLGEATHHAASVRLVQIPRHLGLAQ
jgi:hypothetical protein